MEIKDKELKKVCFRAIDPVLESNIVLPTEEDSHRGFIKWGVNNSMLWKNGSQYQVMKVYMK